LEAILHYIARPYLKKKKKKKKTKEEGNEGKKGRKEGRAGSHPEIHMESQGIPKQS
jgi:hypothetical protein